MKDEVMYGMVLMGATVNAIAIVYGTILGLILKKGIPSKVSDTAMHGLALIIFYLGITGAMNGKHLIVEIISIVIGAVIGECLDLDYQMVRLGNFMEKLFRSKKGDSSISKAFVVSTLFFCVGAMGIVGALQSGLAMNHQTLYAKALIDGIVALIMTTTLGFGVALSSGMVFLYEGIISLMAQGISPYLTTTVINEISCIGAILLLGVSFNLLNLTKIRIMNLVPAVFIPIVLFLFIH